MLDFEGEPGRPLRERRRKRSPLRDVAGMLRSFAYAALAGELLPRRRVPGARPGRLGGARCARASSRDTWREIDQALLPAGAQATEKQLAMFELEKVLYELRYELENRPDWLVVPVQRDPATARGPDAVSEREEIEPADRGSPPRPAPLARCPLRSTTDVRIRVWRPGGQMGRGPHRSGRANGSREELR